jgi:two-component system, NarL family, sensor histidine kinase LiaS
VSAPLELGSATGERALTRPVSSFAAWTTLHAVGFARRRLDRLRGHQRSRDCQVAGDALAEDRRRIAADVHDLIMQDLSFALATARTLLDDPALAPRAGIVVAAGERALAGARDVMRGLVSQDREPVVAAVEAGVRAAARKAPVTFNAYGVQASAQADQSTHDALVHIGREAVTNAIKHAGSDVAVEVVFEHGEEWRLTVRDMGRGFDPNNTLRGFGLESMRARVGELGGSLRVMSVIGQGSTVEATLP